MIVALTLFNRTDEFPRVFCLLQDRANTNLLPVVEYFGKTYVIGRPARRSRRIIAPRYATALWNLYNAVLASIKVQFELGLAQWIQHCTWKRTFRSNLRAYRFPKRSSRFAKNDCQIECRKNVCNKIGWSSKDDC